MSEKINPMAVEFIEELENLADRGDSAGVDLAIYTVYKNPRLLPSNWFTPATDELVLPVVEAIVTILSKKPVGSWKASDHNVINNLMTLTCGPAFKEEKAGLNASGQRWIAMLAKMNTGFSAHNGALKLCTLWLFTNGLGKTFRDDVLKTLLPSMSPKDLWKGDLLLAGYAVHRDYGRKWWWFYRACLFLCGGIPRVETVFRA